MLNVLEAISSENHKEETVGFSGNQEGLKFCWEYGWFVCECMDYSLLLTGLLRNADLIRLQFSEDEERKNHAYTQRVV